MLLHKEITMKKEKYQIHLDVQVEAKLAKKLQLLIIVK
jgi:hypothetical protein